MRTQKDYIRLKKSYIAEKGLNSDNIYQYLTDVQIRIIQKYYELYTRFLFNKLRGSLRLEVSPAKAQKLAELKGTGTWEFAGMVDMMVRGAAVCELGHPLRYVYSARNVNNGQILHFGSRCVGDFFSIDEEGIKALIKIKDVMFSELKEMVSIKETRLFNEHYLYDCGEIGLLLSNVGVKGVEKIRETNPFMPIIIDFTKSGLPLPISLIEQLNDYKVDLSSMLDNLDIFDVDIEKLEALKKSNISVISKMFENSEKDIKASIRNGTIQRHISDFFNFRTINDLNIALEEWTNRERKLNEALVYFKNKGVNISWLDVYKFIVRVGFKREDVQFYRAVQVLMLFDENVDCADSFYMPINYKNKGYGISEEIQDNFDSIINYLATKSFIESIELMLVEKDNVDGKAAEERERKAIMMAYLRSRLNYPEYDKVFGIEGVRDIIMKKNLTFDVMSDRQMGYVESIYHTMKRQDKEEEERIQKSKEKGVQIDTDINNRYTLNERPDILSKIQKLQTQCKDVLQKENPKTYSIMETVLRTSRVSDKQIAKISEAFSLYILKEEPKNVETYSPLSVGKSDNRKWNLMERPDVKEKVVALKNHPEFTNMYATTQNILTNILKYNSVSDKQIDIVERTYNRFYGNNKE